MDKLSLPLIFEIIKYEPRLIFPSELLSKTMYNRLLKNVCYAQTMLEEWIEDKYAR